MDEVSKKSIKSIGRSIANINKQLEILRNEYPEAQMYVEDGSNYLVMCGSSHTDDADPVSLHENVLESFYVQHSGCGAW